MLNLGDARYIKKNELAEYDTIVFGGALYAAGINGLRIIKNNFDVLAGKKIIVFTSWCNARQGEHKAAGNEKQFQPKPA